MIDQSAYTQANWTFMSLFLVTSVFITKFSVEDCSASKGLTAPKEMGQHIVRGCIC